MFCFWGLREVPNIELKDYAATVEANEEGLSLNDERNNRKQKYFRKILNITYREYGKRLFQGNVCEIEFIVGDSGY